MAKAPTIVDVPLGVENKETFDAIKESIELREGVRTRVGERLLDKFVTYQDLIDLGLITESNVPRR